MTAQITVRKLARKSNFDTRPRYAVDGLGPTVVVEAAPNGDEWDEARAKAVAEQIANAFNKTNIFGRAFDEV